MTDKPAETILMLPLDERPVNTRYPEMLARIVGALVLLPPDDIRGRQRSPANREALAAWLRERSREASGAVVSCDYLAYGNLIGARISHESAVSVISRLAVLEEVNAHCPVHAFSVITRVANADDCVEEPLYWAEWGTRNYAWAYLTHKVELGEASEPEIARLGELEAAIPKDLRSDWLSRRLRNHTVNLALLDMASRGALTSLALTSDDTAPYGLSSRERAWLLGWSDLVGDALKYRLQAYPGADEVGSTLLARVINQARGWRPKFFVDYAIDSDRRVVARYEDRPVEETVLGQIGACGGEVVGDPAEADVVLGVVTPHPAQDDYRPEFYGRDRASRTAPYEAFITRLAEHRQAGRKIAIADIAYPNGADPLFTELLLARAADVRPGELAAYGAWNTAGNTLGVVAAESSLSIMAESDAQKAANRLFLTHRFLEDCAYQGLIRREARAECERLWGKREPASDCIESQHEISAFIEGRLQVLLAQLRHAGVGVGIDLVPASTRLPWRRTFEVDFELALADS